MRNLATPGVSVEEIASFPPSVAPVATAIPAFIGYTTQAVARNGDDLTNVSRRITSLLDYEQLYGLPAPETLTVLVDKRVAANGALLGVNVTFDTAPPAVPTDLMYFAIQHYFANDGGPCYIHSIGDGSAVDPADFSAAITQIESVDEVTLLVFPDAVRFTDTEHGGIVLDALNSCVDTQDRFVIADVRNAVPDPGGLNFELGQTFRDEVGASSEDILKYGATYYPYLRTSLPRITDDPSVTIVGGSVLTTVADDGTESSGALFGAAVTLDSVDVQGDPATPGETAVLNAVRAFLRTAYVTLPPSAAVAGVYARIDRTKGVHFAPANAGVFNTIEPAIPITNDLNGRLNIDTTAGKSINVIRSFTGKGTLVWGARTLAGNSNDNRYVPVRRFLNFAEESIEKAIGAFVFAPNDPNTWVRVRTMIENFLTNQWRAGALVGPKPEDAFNVRVGLNETMTNDDILNGIMIVRVGLAIVRPAEFIVLQFEQIQQVA